MFASHEERAARGAKWLDRARPGWYKGIDPETLDPWSDNKCVLGQVFGSFIKVVNAKFFIPTRYNDSYSRKILLVPGIYVGIVWSVRRGFHLTPLRSYEDVAWRAAWRKQIEARQKTVVADTFPAEWSRERDFSGVG